MPHEFLQLGRLTIFRALGSSHRCDNLECWLPTELWLESETSSSACRVSLKILCGDDQLATIATCGWKWNSFLLVYSIFVFFQNIQGRKNEREHRGECAGAPLAANTAIDDSLWHKT
ncbi:hypothetical protein K443DRAFT_106076 [Laccaria amethystina LaAM-08-1]|uniref:Uncharacterized protein n=1 Tax=Laccaria amethystina LaAM-08-1 TaxID=1095629 RepID=A0A0C9X6Z7_9AGAR|nr:hypothetical protein K443DRAFT_106076 [Laccaria amethystina LaAM-08-1]